MIQRIMPVVVMGLLGCGGGGGGGSTPPPPASNHAPVVTAAAVGSSVVMGQSLGLSTQATDQDGDAMTYSWAQVAPASPQGTFSSTTSASPTWTAPTVGAVTAFDLTVTVSDGHGGSTPGTVRVYAKTSSDLSFIADVEPVFLKSCVSGCHSGSQAPSGLSLEADKAYADLVSHPSRNCPPGMLVLPGDPDDSVLIKAMAGNGCVRRMPIGAPDYFDQAPEELATVRTWIQNGAPNN
jgi:hypothetical protein